MAPGAASVGRTAISVNKIRHCAIIVLRTHLLGWTNPWKTLHTGGPLVTLLYGQMVPKKEASSRRRLQQFRPWHRRRGTDGWGRPQKIVWTGQWKRRCPPLQGP